MVRLVLLLGNSNRVIEAKIRQISGVKRIIEPGSPWESGVIIEVGNQESVPSILERIRSTGVRKIDVFPEADERPLDKQTRFNASRSAKGIALFEQASMLLKAQRGLATVVEFSPQARTLDREARKLDLSRIVRTLRSNELNKELVASPEASQKRICSSLNALFDGLATLFGKSPVAQKGLLELSKECEMLLKEDSRVFRIKLERMTDELERLVQVRGVYLRNAQAGGFEGEFLKLTSGSPSNE